MSLIPETLKILFKKPKQIEEPLNLTQQQKTKYRKQYTKTATYAFLILTSLILGIGGAIIQFFETYNFINLGLVVTFSYILEQTLIRTKTEIELIIQRIEKRQNKNLKQEKQIKQETQPKQKEQKGQEETQQ